MKPSILLLIVVVAGAAGAGGWYFGQQQAQQPAAPASTPAATADQTTTPEPPAKPTRTIAEKVAANEPLSALEQAAWRMRQSHARKKKAWVDELPAFTDPPPGDRAPATEAVGLKVGFTTYEEAQAQVAKWGITCKNTSVRALMANYRQKLTQEANAKARAEGKSVDAVSKASWMDRQTKHERNPQVRVTCDDIDLATLGADRLKGQGRLMLIFDSKDLPLRNITIQRRLKDHAQARADLLTSERFWTQAYGVPTKVTFPAPAEGENLKPYKQFRREWNFADLGVKISAINLDRYIFFTEEIAVPWPIRADAPQKPVAQAAP